MEQLGTYYMLSRHITTPGFRPLQVYGDVCWCVPEIKKGVFAHFWYILFCAFTQSLGKIIYLIKVILRFLPSLLEWHFIWLSWRPETRHLCKNVCKQCLSPFPGVKLPVGHHNIKIYLCLTQVRMYASM